MPKENTFSYIIYTIRFTGLIEITANLRYQINIGERLKLLRKLRLAVNYLDFKRICILTHTDNFFDFIEMDSIF